MSAEENRGRDPLGEPPAVDERGTVREHRVLRQLAEDLLKKGVLPVPDLSGIELKRLVHELHVYHAELEMQNAELREAHQALEEARLRYSELFAYAPVAYVLLDRRGLIEELNSAAVELLDLRQGANLPGRPFSVYIATEDHESFFHHLHEVFGKGLRRSLELRCRRRDQTTRPVLMTSCPWPHRDDEPLALTLLLDITERKQLEEQLLQAQKMEAIGRLAGGVAHDFNNRILIIKGRCELLRGTPGLDSEVNTSVAEIEDAAERAAALTQQLLAFARRQILQPKVVNLNQIVSKMTLMLQRLIGAHIRLRNELDPRLWSVRMDPSQAEQILLNLAVNARDAMPEGGTLTLITRNVEIDGTLPGLWDEALAPGEYVRLVASDTGVGMPEDVRQRVFEPFFTTKAAGQGTGLGLSTVFGIVKQSGGYIGVSSEPGQGAMFELLLPRAMTPRSEQISPPVHSTLPRGTETVLLVEDEEDVRTVVREILLTGGYRVLCASDASEALALLQTHVDKVDLLLTDIVLPGMSGRKLALEVAQLRSDIRLLFMSGYPLGIEGDDVPPEDRFLVKPFTVQGLLTKVRDVLGRTNDR